MGIFTPLIAASRNGELRRASPDAEPANPIGRDQPRRTILIASGDDEERQNWIDCLAHPQYRVLAAENGAKGGRKSRMNSGQSGIADAKPNEGAPIR